MTSRKVRNFRCRLEELLQEQATKTTNGVMNAAQAPPTTVGSQDPLNDFSGQKFELTPVQMKNENHIPGNEQGTPSLCLRIKQNK